MFKQAIEVNDLAAARLVLQREGNTVGGYRDGKGRSFLHLLMSMPHANPAWIAFLVDECEVPLWDPHPHPVLHRAARFDRLECARELVRRMPALLRQEDKRGRFARELSGRSITLPVIIPALARYFMKY
jgi:hypothetical protein